MGRHDYGTRRVMGRVHAKVVWQDPPPPGQTNQHTTPDRRRMAMREHPGRWLLWAKASRTGSIPRLKADGFEVTTRRNPTPAGQEGHISGLHPMAGQNLPTGSRLRPGNGVAGTNRPGGEQGKRERPGQVRPGRSASEG